MLLQTKYHILSKKEQVYTAQLQCLMFKAKSRLPIPVFSGLHCVYQHSQLQSLTLKFSIISINNIEKKHIIICKNTKI